MEEWKGVVGYEKYYEVSNLGRIKSLRKNKILLGRLNKRTGYQVINLYDGIKEITRTFHRLVTLAWIPNSENKDTINHKNGIKTDNRVENLEWCTQSENLQHAYDTGLHKYHGKNGIEIFATEIKTGIEQEFSHTREASRILKLDPSSITKCCRGKLKAFRGYKFRYKNPEEQFTYKDFSLYNFKT